MKTAICYYSTHHGNTLQVARAMTQGYDVDFFDLSTQREAALADYDLVGFASGIYGFAFHPSVVAFGPFKLMGGSGKGRPTQEDFHRAGEFFKNIVDKL